VSVIDASPFTLYGDVLTEEVVGVDEEAVLRYDHRPTVESKRIGLTVL
jgi:hypothetical protein